MSNTRRSRGRQLPANALTYCPDYIQLDRKARDDSKSRFREHVMERRDLLVQCLQKPLEEIRNPALSLQFDQPPQYEDNDDIVDTAINTMCNTVDKWDGVQFSKQFIAEFNSSGKIMDRRRFETISKNHQDQTSWKISGNKFFAPYIARARQYFYDYCQCISNLQQVQRMEVYKLACISYAVTLLSETIRFHRTKPKPLIRHKTLVRSDGIHVELEHLYSELKVKSFIVAAKKKRKQSDSKNTVIAKNFHRRLLDCCRTLHREQKQKVYELCGASVDVQDVLTREVWPRDLLDSDENDVEQDEENTPYESAIPPANPTHSNSTNSARHRRRPHPLITSQTRSSRRDFQSIGHSREQGIRHEINSHHRRRQRRVRDEYRHNLLNNHNRQYCYADDIDDDDDDEEANFDVEKKDEQISNNYLHRNTLYNQPNGNLMHRNALQFDEQSGLVQNEEIPPRLSTPVMQPRNDAMIANCVECGSNTGSCSCDSTVSFSGSVSYPRVPLRRDGVRSSMPPPLPLPTYVPNPPAPRSSVDDSRSSNSQTSSEARLCEQFRQENAELREELWRRMQALAQMQVAMQPMPTYSDYTSHAAAPYGAYAARDNLAQNGYQYASYEQQAELQTPVEVMTAPRNDNMYFNALPPQLQHIQPSMIIRGSSLNGRNRANQSSENSNNQMNMNHSVSPVDRSFIFEPPFIDAPVASTMVTNLMHPDMDDLADDVEIRDIPSLPN